MALTKSNESGFEMPSTIHYDSRSYISYLCPPFVLLVVLKGAILAEGCMPTIHDRVIETFCSTRIICSSSRFPCPDASLNQESKCFFFRRLTGVP